MAEGVAEGLCVALGVLEGVALAVAEGVALVVALGVADAVRDGVLLGVALGVRDGVEDGESVALGVLLGVAEAVAEAEGPAPRSANAMDAPVPSVCVQAKTPVAPAAAFAPQASVTEQSDPDVQTAWRTLARETGLVAAKAAWSMMSLEVLKIARKTAALSSEVVIAACPSLVDALASPTGVATANGVLLDEAPRTGIMPQAQDPVQLPTVTTLPVVDAVARRHQTVPAPLVSAFWLATLVQLLPASLSWTCASPVASRLVTQTSRMSPDAMVGAVRLEPVAPEVPEVTTAVPNVKAMATEAHTTGRPRPDRAARCDSP